jgi:predicted lipoprotein with Yx(FWY)xxD motif
LLAVEKEAEVIRTKRRHAILALTVGLSVVLTACGGATEAPPAAEQAESVPSVSVSDQDASGGQVTIDQVTAAEAGWMVIHADADGSPGPVIGLTAVPAGTSTGVGVDIDLAAATDRLYAMLHVDSGVVGTYEFPDADPPARVSDQVVVTPFNVELGAAQSAPAAAVVATAQSDLGTVLVDGDGFALYAFTQDSAGTSNCSGDCLAFWPPLVGGSPPEAGLGVDAVLLGTLTRDDGSQQVTYNGLPLYHYSEDGAAGDTNGQGFGNAWFLVTPAGEMLGQPAAGESEADGEDLDSLY